VKLLKSNKPKGPGHNLKIRFKVADRELDISKMNGPVEKQLRKQMDKAVAKLVKQHGDLVHPETGERPDALFFSPKAGSLKVQMRLVTDSEPLRAWLAEKGLAKLGEEVLAPVPAAAVAAEAATQGA